MKAIFKVLMSIVVLWSLFPSTLLAEKPPDQTLSPYFVVKDGDSSIDQLPLKETKAAVILSLLASWWITLPLKRLTRYANDIGEGKDVGLPKLNSTEIGDMGKAFEKMKTTLEGKKYIEQCIQTLTHEVKSPVSAIVAAAAELLQENMPPEQRAKFPSNIRSEAGRINDIVERMLALSALENLKMLSATEKIPLTSLLSGVIESKQPLLKQKGLGLNFVREVATLHKSGIILENRETGGTRTRLFLQSQYSQVNKQFKPSIIRKQYRCKNNIVLYMQATLTHTGLRSILYRERGKPMALQTHSICRLVKSEDLNHHGTLFAGKTAMWVVESGFIAAAALTHPENIVCINVHGMLFKKPVHSGQIIRLDSKVVLASKTRLVSYVKMLDNATEESCMEAFLSFVHVDLQGKAKPHGIVLEYADPEDAALLERAKALK